MMIIYVAVVAALIWGFADKFALLFISADETEIIADTALFLHFNVSFFPLLGMLSILRYSIQGAGYTQACHVFRRFRDDSTCAGKCDYCSTLGICRSMCGRPNRMAFCQSLLDTRIYLCISPFARHCSQRTLVFTGIRFQIPADKLPEEY